jgi:hypothetical protein
VRGEWTEHDVDEYWWPLRKPAVIKTMVDMLAEFDFGPRAARAVDRGRLVIRFGELDTLIPWREGMRHALGFAGADAAVMPGVGHVPADEVPGEIADLVATVARQ